jgi:RluA family pseudouridine synthase
MEELTVLERLAALYPQAKKTTLREMVETKRVLLRGAVVRSLKQKVAAEDALEVLDEGTRAEVALGEGLKMVHFDAEVIVVEKPAGLLTSTDAEERRPTAWRILSDFFSRQNHRNKVQLIHRLDRDASGLLVFARTQAAYASLKQQFFEHTITRQYEVIVHGTPRPASGRLEHLLLEDGEGVVHVTKDAKKGKLAILDYEVAEVSKAKRIARLRCTLFTGRKHQIRVQLKAAGHAVCGDPVYGKADEPPHRLGLHAVKLAFKHPTSGKAVSFGSIAPGSFAHLFRNS